MLVYLAPCGMGLGHAYRVLTIANELVKRGHEVVFSTYGDAVLLLKKMNQRVLTTFELEYAQDKEGMIDLRQTIAEGPKNLYIFARHVATELYYMNVFEPDVVVSDSRLSSTLAAIYHRIPNLLIINQLKVKIPTRRPTKVKFFLKSLAENVLLEGVMHVWGRSDVIIIPDFPPPYTIARENIVLFKEYRNKTLLIGPLISKHPEELPPRELLRKELGVEDKKLIFIVVSGLRREREVFYERIVKLFSKISLPSNYKVVITAGFAESYGKIEYLKENVELHYFIKDKFKYLKAADVLVSHGGHNTLAEGLYYGIPQLMLPSKLHTERKGNSKAIEDMGAGILLYQEDLNEHDFLKALEKLTSKPIYWERAQEISRKVSKLKPVQTLVELIEKLVELSSRS